MTRKLSVLGAGIAALIIITVAMAATVTDRGLPDENLNNVAGSDRSNVAWSFGNDWMTGDNFVVGSAGETWIVTSVKTWQVAGVPGTIVFGDRYSDASLYVGLDGVELVATGTINAGTNINNNASITHAAVTYDDPAQPFYDAFGSPRQVWETTFSGLSLVVDGGTTYNFAVDGSTTSSSFNWFNHASNAGLSGTSQQGADDRYLAWPKSDLTSSPFVCDSGDAINCGGWDKSSDVNVVVEAHQLATTTNACKNGGWMDLVRSNGSSFHNQGDCVSYVQTGR